MRANVYVMTLTKREARRKRNLEDYARTQQALPTGMKGTAYKIPPGPTYREHLEDEIKRAVANWKKARSRDTDPLQVRAMRGVVRGLCRALLIFCGVCSYLKENYNLRASRNNSCPQWPTVRNWAIW